MYTHKLYVCAHIALQISTPSLSLKVPNNNLETSYGTYQSARTHPVDMNRHVLEQQHHPWVYLRSFTYILEAVNHFSEVKMKIFITKQQQHRLYDLIKRVTPLKHDQSDTNMCTTDSSHYNLIYRQ